MRANKYDEDANDEIEHYEYPTIDDREDHIEYMLNNGYSHICNHGNLCASFQKEEES